MKLKDVTFWGFTQEELKQIRKEKGSGEEEITLITSQDIADIVGFDVITIIAPGGQIAIMKAGE